MKEVTGHFRVHSSGRHQLGALVERLPKVSNCSCLTKMKSLALKFLSRFSLLPSLFPEKRTNPFSRSPLWRPPPSQWFRMKISSSPTSPSPPTVITSPDPSPSSVSPSCCISSQLSPMITSLLSLTSRLSHLRSMLQIPARVVISYPLPNTLMTTHTG